MPSYLLLNSGKTEPPKLLTESDLISLMEKNEIGTDATIADHINKILERNYAYKTGNYFNPSTLGIALVLGYDEIGFNSSLSKPFLRREVKKIFIFHSSFFLFFFPPPPHRLQPVVSLRGPI